MSIDPLSHVVARFGHSLTMIAELISASNDRAFPPAVRTACLEAWFTNYRLLIEFLVIGVSRNCANAQDLAPGWPSGTSTGIQRLKEDYGWASEHIVHIGELKPDALEQNVAPAILRLKAGMLLDVVENLLASLEAHDSPYSDLVRVALVNARSVL